MAAARTVIIHISAFSSSRSHSGRRHIQARPRHSARLPSAAASYRSVPLITKPQTKIAAVAAPAERFRAAPQKPRMQAVIGDIVAVAEAGAQLRAAVLYAGVMVGALRHVDAPHAAGDLKLRRSKAGRLSIRRSAFMSSRRTRSSRSAFSSRRRRRGRGSGKSR